MANYIFKKVILHNFLSYGHSEFDLRDKNYCLVRGINNCPLDNALSNGSGKSSWISGICWALTGETVQGITTNIKNIYVDEKECYVTLFFDVDNDSYEITRIKEPSANLKIIRNGEDISGKGIRESALVLAQYLPDLNRGLLTSVILLGQGLPNKFTDNTPSGRKEVLEKLSKSDFIIEDIKERISSRVDKLNSEIRDEENKATTLTTKLSIYTEQLDRYIKERDTAVAPDYNTEISNNTQMFNALSEDVKKLEESIKEFDKQIAEYNTKLDKNSDDRQQELDEELACYNNRRDVLVEERSKITARIYSLREEIKRLKSIKDVCPTCGQKIPGIVIPDTSAQEAELAEEESKNSTYNNEISTVTNKHQEYVSEIVLRYGKESAAINELKDEVLTRRQNSTETLNKLKGRLYEIQSTISRLIYERDNHEAEWKKLLDNISTTEEEIRKVNAELVGISDRQHNLREHLEVVKKMETLVKRDFRGFLLSNIIEFIDQQAKEYCNDIFGTRELNFKLSGNDIDIEYCGKDFASLSGGEKQRVDLIIQFAIRKMLSQYLDFNSNILCLDEITDALDSKSTAGVINLISNQLTDIESVFIISHHASELNLPTDTEMVIVKGADGISTLL